MRIGFFTDTYAPQVNGVVTALLSLRRELERRKNRVFVFAPRAKGAKGEASTFYYRSWVYPLYPEYRMALFSYRKAYRDAMHAKLDIIHAHSSMFLGVASIVSSRKLRVPLVGTFHTLIPDFVSLFYGRAVARLTRPFLWKAIMEFYGRCDAVTVPSENTRQVMLEKGLDPVVIPNGIDFREFGKPGKDIRKELGIGEDDFLVLHVGRLSYEKKVIDILRSAAEVTQRHRDVKYLILSDGPRKKKLENFVKKKRLEDRIMFTGYVPKEDLSSYYSGSDLFVSASPFETQGLAAIEAMYFGKPVLAVNSGALADLVTDGRNGLLYDGKVSQLTRLTSFLVTDPRARSRLAMNAKKDVRRYDIKICTDKLLKLYKSMV